MSRRRNETPSPDPAELPEVYAEFQLFQDRLCMPFDKFHEAIEHRLGRGVWTHEFIDADNLRREMMGEKEPPSLEDIMNLIPAEKRIVIVTEKET